MKEHPEDFPIVYALSPIPVCVNDAATAKGEIVRIKAVLQRLEKAVRRDERKQARSRKGGRV